ncbi:MAG: 4-hydroxyphenylacetate 3-hydroxylase family protein [Chloroflexi bacterium]|nr:4-hydroxyphenylacetate 3-hydroxylase family protein [Chloroflexota bacterium]
MMTGKEYRESIRKLKRRVFILGEEVQDVVDHPLTRPHVNAAALTYELAEDPQHQDLMTATSHLTGRRINRFTHIHQSTGDLVKKVKMLRLLGRRTGTCFQRCVGWDALNALYNVTYEVDLKHGTQYFQRLTRFLVHVQDADLMSEGAMTDPKGDRSLPPSKQPDPDMYLHVVARRDDGIVVRGAKLHQTGAVNSHEIIVMPTTALKEEDKDYAVACAVPSDAPGLLFVFGRQASDERRLSGKLDQGNPRFGFVGGEAMVIFDNVFVPWERVFLHGEHEFALPLVETFASYHRQNYGGCKTGVADVLIGAAALMAQYNGVVSSPHIRDKLVEMVQLAETLYACSISCSSEGRPTPAGACYVDPLLANTAKLNTTRNIYEICRLAHDITGGLLATSPSERDLLHPEVGPFIRKYFKGASEVPAEARLRLARLIEGMTGCTALAESMHGAGSPQALRIGLARQANLNEKMELAKALAGLDEGEKP